MVAAFLEWFLFLAAFLYCLCKVYTKADTYSVKILAVVMMILFTALRFVVLYDFASLDLDAMGKAPGWPR